MATGACANDLRVIHISIHNRNPRRGSRLMAGIAGIGGIDVVGAFTTGNSTVVATDTTTHYLGMIHIRGSHRNPD